MNYRGKCLTWLRASLHSVTFAGIILIAAGWFAGAFVWRYYANPMDASQEAAWGFSPRLREAEDVLREFYALRWGADVVGWEQAGARWWN